MKDKGAPSFFFSSPVTLFSLHIHALQLPYIEIFPTFTDLNKATKSLFTEDLGKIITQMNSVDFPEDPVQPHNHYSLIINMQDNSHRGQGEHCIDIELSKNNMQILSSFNFTKDLVQDFFFFFTSLQFPTFRGRRRPGSCD